MRTMEIFNEVCDLVLEFTDIKKKLLVIYCLLTIYNSVSQKEI